MAKCHHQVIVWQHWMLNLYHKKCSMVSVLFSYQEKNHLIIDRFCHSQSSLEIQLHRALVLKNESFQSFGYSQMEYLRWWSTSSQSIYSGQFYNIANKVCQATLFSDLDKILKSLIKSITAYDFINDRLELVDSIGHCPSL